MTATLSNRARRQMSVPGERPLLLADWDDVLFVHFALDPAALQPQVPFPLDLFRGRAYVSLVCFTQRRLRPRVGGRLAALLSAPLAEHAFLNVRTYVRRNGERAIYFLAEWIPNRLAALIGPTMYGLPYRLGRLRYAIRARTTPASAVDPPRALRGFATGRGADCETAKRPPASAANQARVDYRAEVAAPSGRLRVDATFPDIALRPALPGLERFLLERYTAFTFSAGTERRFRVWHEPWQCTPVTVALHDTTLLTTAFPWFAGAKLVAAHYSPGVRDVWIGPPRRLRLMSTLSPSPGTPGEASGMSDRPRAGRGEGLLRSPLPLRERVRVRGSAQSRTAQLRASTPNAPPHPSPLPRRGEGAGSPVRECAPLPGWWRAALARARRAGTAFRDPNQAPPVSGRKKGGGVMSLGCSDNPRAADVTFETPGG